MTTQSHNKSDPDWIKVTFHAKGDVEALRESLAKYLDDRHFEVTDLVAPKPLANTDDANPPKTNLQKLEDEVEQKMRKASSGNSPNTQDLEERWTCFNDDCDKQSRCIPCRLNLEKVTEVIQRENNNAKLEILRGFRRRDFVNPDFYQVAVIDRLEELRR